MQSKPQLRPSPWEWWTPTKAVTLQGDNPRPADCNTTCWRNEESISCKQQEPLIEQVNKNIRPRMLRQWAWSPSLHQQPCHCLRGAKPTGKARKMPFTFLNSPSICSGSTQASWQAQCSSEQLPKGWASATLCALVSCLQQNNIPKKDVRLLAGSDKMELLVLKPDLHIWGVDGSRQSPFNQTAEPLRGNLSSTSCTSLACLHPLSNHF